jgi:anti-sigma regulatory factor (Ser/Thr protein kinase)
MSSNKHDGSFLNKAQLEPSWRFREERIHSETEIGPALKTFTAEMTRWGYHYTDIFSSRWAIGEALLNAIRHGHQGDASKTVQLNYLTAADYVLAEVIDEGPGFDSTIVPSPFTSQQEGPLAKKGLFFMRLFTSWIRFEGRGNRIILCKLRSPSKPATAGTGHRSE